MSTTVTSEIVCNSCKRKFAWKPQLAGKRVKCKCGHTIAIAASTLQRPAAPVRKPVPVMKSLPPSPSPQPAPVDDAGLDGLFALADDAERASASMPVEVVDFAPVPVPEKIPKAAASKSPLGYQRGATALEQKKAAAAAAALVDVNRDLYVPLALMLTGLGLYVAYYCVRFHLGSSAAATVCFGLSVLMVIKAGALVGFALVVAGPLGVGFGSLWSAVLKLAAIAVFTDGVTSWVDMALSKMTGGAFGGGVFGYGMIAFPVALGLYWSLLIHLFSMDPGDSWTVVALLTIFDRGVKFLLFMLLVETIMGMGGVSSSAFSTVSGGGSGSSPNAHASALATRVDNLKENDSLREARKYIADGHQSVLTEPVNGWYAAGCHNVWFEMGGRDINGRSSAAEVIVELPDGKVQRAQCFEILKKYYKDVQIEIDPESIKDTGDSYLEVGIR